MERKYLIHQMASNSWRSLYLGHLVRWSFSGAGCPGRQMPPWSPDSRAMVEAWNRKRRTIGCLATAPLHWPGAGLPVQKRAQCFHPFGHWVESTCWDPPLQINCIVGKHGGSPSQPKSHGRGNKHQFLLTPDKTQPHNGWSSLIFAIRPLLF